MSVGPPATLVAGIGNIFLSDDGFGVEVASRLAAAELPTGVRVVDYGIRGMHLAYDLANGVDTAILIDAAPRGGQPGTVYLIEPDLDAAPVTVGAAAEDSRPEDSTPEDPASGGTGPNGGLAASPFFDAHGMQPDVVLRMLAMLGDERPAKILVVGCEPATVEDGMGLSAPVAAAVDEAVRLVIELVTVGDQETTHGGRPHVPRHPR